MLSKLGMGVKEAITSSQIAQYCGQLALEKKAFNIVILDLYKKSTIADYFVIMSATSAPHVQAIGDHLKVSLYEKKQRAKTEGLSEGSWALLDFGDVIVHIFQDYMREFYDLEGLWKDAPKTLVKEVAS